MGSNQSKEIKPEDAKEVILIEREKRQPPLDQEAIRRYLKAEKEIQEYRDREVRRRNPEEFRKMMELRKVQYEAWERKQKEDDRNEEACRIPTPQVELPFYKEKVGHKRRGGTRTGIKLTPLFSFKIEKK
jgi:hypothetical protein